MLIVKVKATGPLLTYLNHSFVYVGYIDLSFLQMGIGELKGGNTCRNLKKIKIFFLYKSIVKLFKNMLLKLQVIILFRSKVISKLVSALGTAQVCHLFFKRVFLRY